MKLSIQHIDTCLPCYVLDHCNGDNEQLLGTGVDRSYRMYQVKRDLIWELKHGCEKMAESGVTDEQAIDAINEMFSGIHPLKTFDKGLSPYDEESGEMACAWFRFTWESE